MDITFDNNGFCNYCTEFLNNYGDKLFDEKEKQDNLRIILEQIIKSGSDKTYDCVVGVSGGVDSSYVLYMAKKMGLKPLAVHIDNGWNSKLSTDNIEKIVTSLKIDLETYTINQNEFRDLQRAFFKANVVDIEMLTDNAIVAVLYIFARKHKIKFILGGQNIACEGMRGPQGWSHNKKDTVNIKSIYKKFGNSKKISNIPVISPTGQLTNKYLFGIKWINILDFIPYIKNDVVKLLEKEMSWKPYKKKHYESIFTRFYQGYILPKKFKVDKRKYHYSNLICSGQMTRKGAVELMKKEPYDDPVQLKEDMKYVLNKLGFSKDEFEQYLYSPTVPHSFYSTDFLCRIAPIKRKIKSLFNK